MRLSLRCRKVAINSRPLDVCCFSLLRAPVNLRRTRENSVKRFPPDVQGEGESTMSSEEVSSGQHNDCMAWRAVDLAMRDVDAWNLLERERTTL